MADKDKAEEEKEAEELQISEDTEEHKKLIQWHNGFVSALKYELREDADSLSMKREELSNQIPPRMDIMAVKKGAGAIKNEVGHIFRQFNFIEYKGPKGDLGLKELFRIGGFACIYNQYDEKDETIPIDDITLTLARFAKPEGLFEELKKLDISVEQYRPGIYYLKGAKVIFPIQILVGIELGPVHVALRILTDNVNLLDVKKIVNLYQNEMNDEERKLINTAIEISFLANKELFEMIRKEDPEMHEALLEILKDDVDATVDATVDSTIVQGVLSIMNKLPCGMKKAVELIGVPAEKRDRIVAKVKAALAEKAAQDQNAG